MEEMKRRLIHNVKDYKRLICIALCAVMALMLIGCNKQIIYLDYKFNYAVIFLPNGEKIEGKVSSWNDYENSDMVQVKIDGVTYLTHSANVILEAR